MNLQIFSLFPLLPPEIRLTVWCLAMTPRVVNITPLIDPHEDPRQQENPSLLRVCHESRTTTLRRYELSVDIDKTYINFNIDTVYINFEIGSLGLYPLYPSGNDAMFNFLAIDIEWIESFGPDKFMKKISRCRRLRELTFFVKFNQVIRKDCKRNLSKTLDKYEDVENARLSDLAGYRDDDSVTYFEKCEALAIMWIWGAREYSINKDTWPDISVVAQATGVNSAGWS